MKKDINEQIKYSNKTNENHINEQIQILSSKSDKLYNDTCGWLYEVKESVVA
jgi:hypothetical protein